jgi:hypothetical protein
MKIQCFLPQNFNSFERFHRNGNESFQLDVANLEEILRYSNDFTNLQLIEILMMDLIRMNVL